MPGADGDAPADYDLCIWDFIPGEAEIPKTLDPGNLQKHLFILQRKHLNTLREFTGTADLNVILKPVTHATLRAFLSTTCPRWSDEVGFPAASGSLRADRDEMLQCLIQANLKLQEYDQERTNFLARSIHDFRAPLTAVTGYCGLLLDQQLGELRPEQQEILERMHHSAKRLSRMADAMFQLSICQNVERKLNLERTDIRECVAQAVHEITPFIDDKQISVMVDVEPSPEDFFCERARVEQTLINLLDNACKFTPPSGSIQVKGYPFFWERRLGGPAQLNYIKERRRKQVEIPNCFRVDIRDSGPGIPAVHLSKIFEEYTSYSGGQDRSGGGLGLAICKMIVQQHHGRMWAATNPEGAVFSFVLPYRAADQDVPGNLNAGRNGGSRRANSTE
jgi:signal transduction histidine kinase